MPALPHVRLIAALLVWAQAAPSAAETFTVNGALVQSVAGLDRTILAYGENYPPPTPTHAVARNHPRVARFRRSVTVVFYRPPCLFWDGRMTAAVSCRMVPALVGEPLSYGFR
jgi:hypothetical protein